MPFQSENTTTYAVQDELENVDFRAGGEAIGLLLALTYSANSGYTLQTENSTTFTFQTENTTSYT